MPSSYTPPDVIVQQVRRTNTGTLRPPQLPVVVVGLARQIVTRETAGTYDATVETTVPLPGLTPGAVTDVDSINILLDARSDSGKPLGLFQLKSSEFTVVNDAENRPQSLILSGSLILDLSILSSRNNQAGVTSDDDHGSGTPEGIVFSDGSIDFLGRGATPEGDSFVVVDSPASMAGTYRIIEMIASGNVVHSVVVEKVLATDFDQPELVKSTVIDGSVPPTGSTIRGFDAATHEAALINGNVSNLTTAATGLGIGVVGLIDIDGSGTTEFDSSEIETLLTSGDGVPHLQLPGINSSLEVEFAPVDANGDPINRDNALWVATVDRVSPGDWLRVLYSSLPASGVEALVSISYSGPTVGTITFDVSVVDAGWAGRTLRITDNGNSANNLDYEVLSANAGTNTVIVDLTPYGNTFPGGSSVTPGSAQILAQVEMDRDFKVMTVDAVNKSIIVSALGGAAVSNDIVVMPTLGIDSFRFLSVIKGRADNINGAGDFITFSVDGAPYRYEASSVTPAAITVVGTLPSFSATADVLASADVDSTDPTTDFSSGVLVFTTPSFVQVGWVGKTLRLQNNAGTGNNGDYLITSVSTGDNSVTVAGTFTTPGTEDGNVDIIDFIDVPVVYRRGISFRNSAASYDLTKRLSDGWTADIEVSYKAIRHDLPLNGLMELSSRQDIQTVIGEISPDNPLALGADMIVRSGLADGVRTFYALATNGESVGDHVDAMSYLETADVYFVVPLTQDEDVIAAYKGHVDTQSQPLNKHERVVLVNTALVTTESILPLAGTPSPVGTVATANTIQSDIDWGLVNPGDVVDILVNPGTVDETVEASNRVLSIDLSTNTATFLSDWATALVGQSRSFNIHTYPLTKSEQAENWRDYAKSVNDMRVMIIRPDEVELAYTDNTVSPSVTKIVTVGGQYACAAFAGLAAALNPEAPLTNVPIPGIRRLIHSNDYFRPDQLNTIAEGGNNILIQETRNSIPYSRQQLTTDMTSITTREFSIIKIVDYSAKFVRNSLRPYIGNRNITAQYLTQLRGTTEAIIRALVRGNVLLPKTELLSLKQDLDSPDQIIIEIALDIPYPANRIYVTLFV